MVLLAAVAAGSVLVFSAANAARKPVTKTFHVALTGESESPAGDPVATGTATFKLRSDGKVCYQLAAKNLPRAVAAHIHTGKAGVAGPVMLALCGPCRTGLSGQGTLTHAQSEVLERRGAYVNVHTGKNPGGEIRGQLRLVG
jgi:hypothetical protein